MNITLSRTRSGHLGTSSPRSVLYLAATLECLALGRKPLGRLPSALFIAQATSLCDNEELAELFFTALERT